MQLRQVLLKSQFFRKFIMQYEVNQILRPRQPSRRPADSVKDLEGCYV